MSDMKKLLESITKFSFANPKQKPGDQWRGKDKGTPGNKLVGGAAEGVEYCDACDRVKSKCICDNDLNKIKESLVTEYKYFVQEVDNETGEDETNSPVANINPASHNQQHVMDEDDPNPAPGTQVPGTQPAGTTAPAQPGQQAQTTGQPPAAGQQQAQTPGQPPKPGQPQQQQPPAKPGQPAPVNPQQVNAMTQLKQATGNAKINPSKAAAAASVAQNNPQALNPDQKSQLQQVGQAVAPGLDNPQDIAKIKSVLPTATNPAAQPPK